MWALALVFQLMTARRQVCRDLSQVRHPPRQAARIRRQVYRDLSQVRCPPRPMVMQQVLPVLLELRPRQILPVHPGLQSFIASIPHHLPEEQLIPQVPEFLLLFYLLVEL